MATAPQRPGIVVIVGPTASGKSDLATAVAKKFGGEIIAADSRTIYKGMDIGTAKPSVADQMAIRHWGLDLLKPGERYSAAEFKKYAEQKIAEIQKRGKLPIMVGGTGLYIDAVLFDFSFVAPSRLPLHWRLTMPMWSINKLQKVIAQNDWPLPENSRNRRHLINTIRRQGQVGGRLERPRFNPLIIGLMPPDKILKQRIEARADKLFNRGLATETERLIKQYGQKSLANTAGLAYRICTKYLDGELTKAQAIDQIKSTEWQYARRQKTWYKRNKFINWFDDSNSAFEHISGILNN